MKNGELLEKKLNEAGWTKPELEQAREIYDRLLKAIRKHLRDGAVDHKIKLEWQAESLDFILLNDGLKIRFWRGRRKVHGCLMIQDRGRDGMWAKF
jgi:hypothetical protein